MKCGCAITKGRTRGGSRKTYWEFKEMTTVVCNKWLINATGNKD